MEYNPLVHGTVGDDSASEDALNEQERWQRLQDACSGFISRLEDEASTRVRRRATIDERWLQDLRQYHGQYDPTTAAILANDDERSRVFINITRPKTTSWAARLGDMLFPNDDKNWGIEPTPVPELTEQARMAVDTASQAEQQAAQAVDEANRMVAEGQPQPQVDQQVQEAEGLATRAAAARQIERDIRLSFDEAKRRCEHMAREIEDQLGESRYAPICRDVIDDACKLGVGILKGPLTSSKSRRNWVKRDGTSEFMLKDRGDPAPMYRRVNPWHFFPDPDAMDMEDGESSFERHLLSRTKLKRMAKLLNWNRETVADILRDQPMPTSAGDMNWLVQLRTMGESQENAIINRYVVWEYHGPMEREDIYTMLCSLGRGEDAEAFMQSNDGTEEHMVICYFCQGRLLKIEEYFPLDSGETLYSVFPFEKSEATILGAVGVPNLMRHEQSMLNGAVRMMMDNAALSVGPQIVIDKTQVEPENGSWKMTPRKIWTKKGQEVSKDQAPFATYNIPMNQAQLAGIIELALKFIDDVVSMPTIAQGEQGAHVTQTSTGMSMLFNSANVVFRRVVKNWDDDLTTPAIRRAYDWNMQFNPKEHIKGDMKAIARGTSVLLVREVQSQQLMVIAERWSTHPLMGAAIKVYDVMRMTLQALNINPAQVLCTPEEFDQRLQKMAESSGQDSPETIAASARIEVANIQAASHKEQAVAQREIAELNQQTEILKLIQRDGVDLQKIQAMLAGKKMDLDSSERLFAAEAAIEQRNAEDARARGEEPQGSGGFISAGGGVE